MLFDVPRTPPLTETQKAAIVQRAKQDTPVLRIAGELTPAPSAPPAPQILADAPLGPGWPGDEARPAASGSASTLDPSPKP